MGKINGPKGGPCCNIKKVQLEVTFEIFLTEFNMGKMKAAKGGPFGAN